MVCRSDLTENLFRLGSLFVQSLELFGKLLLDAFFSAVRAAFSNLSMVGFHLDNCFWIFFEYPRGSDFTALDSE
jgi:hypothetical protein